MNERDESEVDRRWQEGVPHDVRSVEMGRDLRDIDEEHGNSAFDFKFGGDGDNGEELLYLLDIYFAQLDDVAWAAGATTKDYVLLDRPAYAALSRAVKIGRGFTPDEAVIVMRSLRAVVHLLPGFSREEKVT